MRLVFLSTGAMRPIEVAALRIRWRGVHQGMRPNIFGVDRHSTERAWRIAWRAISRLFVLLILNTEELRVKSFADGRQEGHDVDIWLGQDRPALPGFLEGVVDRLLFIENIPALRLLIANILHGIPGHLHAVLNPGDKVGLILT